MSDLANLAVDQATCQAPLSMTLSTIIIIVCCVLGLIWAVFNFLLVKKIDVESGSDGGESEGLIEDIP